MKAKLLYLRAINQWGYEAQLDMALEEMLELSLELRRFMRNGGEWDAEKIEEEIADVEIMIGQLKLIFNEKNIRRIKVRKKKRLARRLENALNNNK